jgi:hypothetical protein
MKKVVVGMALVAILLFSIDSLAEPAEYRLGPDDRLNVKIWTWGNGPIQQLDTSIRPDIRACVKLKKAIIYWMLSPVRADLPKTPIAKKCILSVAVSQITIRRLTSTKS